MQPKHKFAKCMFRHFGLDGVQQSMAQLSNQVIFAAGSWVTPSNAAQNIRNRNPNNSSGCFSTGCITSCDISLFCTLIVSYYVSCMVQLYYVKGYNSVIYTLISKTVERKEILFNRMEKYNNFNIPLEGFYDAKYIPMKNRPRMRQFQRA